MTKLSGVDDKKYNEAFTGMYASTGLYLLSLTSRSLVHIVKLHITHSFFYHRIPNSPDHALGLRL